MDDNTILVVEDNPDDQLLTVRALRKACNRTPVVVLDDGQEALDYLFTVDDTRSEDPIHQLKVILLDIKLPRVNGLEVLKQLRSSPRTNWIPVIMVSSSDEPGEQLEAYRLGANSYINKTVDFNQFTDHMKVLADYWLRVNKLPQPTQVDQGSQGQGG